MSAPYFSIISVCRNDAWPLSKSARSVFRQTFKDFEYIIIDGASQDGTTGLIEFWKSQGLVSKTLSEPDSGVYNAMNKGVRLAEGEFLCFLNAGDTFASDTTLGDVHEYLSNSPADGVLGWGELNGQIWASWAECDAYKLASLGFCHQSLFVRRRLLLDHPFDERPHKTDSDTLQLARLYAAGANIPISQTIWAIRGAEPGISADLERTKISIADTLTTEYPLIDSALAERILSFRRQCQHADEIADLLDSSAAPLRTHLAYMVLDTLFLRQSAKLTPAVVNRILESACRALLADVSGNGVAVLQRLTEAQNLKRSLLEKKAEASQKLRNEISIFGESENARIANIRNTGPNKRPSQYIASLTSFPARVESLHFVIQSLLEQSCPPAEIHLWLGADEIPNRKWLPRTLLELENRNLRIHFAPKTFLQYNKFLHNWDINSTLPFVTVDDDVIYPPHAMECLINAHVMQPGIIVANRCHLMRCNEAGDILPYNTWPREVRIGRPSHLAFPTGVGGVLYPPGFLSDPLVTDVTAIMAHAPYADDIWLKACALAKRVPAVSTELSQKTNWYVRYTPTMTAGSLQATNVDLRLNDRQMQRCHEWLSRVRPDWTDDILAEIREVVV